MDPCNGKVVVGFSGRDFAPLVAIGDFYGPGGGHKFPSAFRVLTDRPVYAVNPDDEPIPEANRLSASRH